MLALLGPDADETANYQNAALKAANEIYGLGGIDQYFAWFNRGTNLVALAGLRRRMPPAYDEAFKIYPTIPETERPWRMLWYQTGPYWAYFYSSATMIRSTWRMARSTPCKATKTWKRATTGAAWPGPALGDTAGCHPRLPPGARISSRF